MSLQIFKVSRRHVQIFKSRVVAHLTEGQKVPTHDLHVLQKVEAKHHLWSNFNWPITVDWLAFYISLRCWTNERDVKPLNNMCIKRIIKLRKMIVYLPRPWTVYLRCVAAYCSRSLWQQPCRPRLNLLEPCSDVIARQAQLRAARLLSHCHRWCESIKAEQ